MSYQGTSSDMGESLSRSSRPARGSKTFRINDTTDPPKVSPSDPAVSEEGPGKRHRRGLPRAGEGWRGAEERPGYFRRKAALHLRGAAAGSVMGPTGEREEDRPAATPAAGCSRTQAARISSATTPSRTVPPCPGAHQRFGTVETASAQPWPRQQRPEQGGCGDIGPPTAIAGSIEIALQA